MGAAHYCEPPVRNTFHIVAQNTQNHTCEIGNSDMLSSLSCYKGASSNTNQHFQPSKAGELLRIRVEHLNPWAPPDPSNRTRGGVAQKQASTRCTDFSALEGQGRVWGQPAGAHQLGADPLCTPVPKSRWGLAGARPSRSLSRWF